ncbi:MAG: hypothetical protein Q8N35_07525 [Methylococcaceae bacterium]|nr:hypothetical protein [Methylococcaceae bacterium]MDZ4155462.1 hypothetical protein [Methylococcales bacterium]MDP2392147.1 hypothetical protein [Methylococcaceae bacterium]MDP3019419.1 hypothetical protein [Methylococcaceae bacterium]MDP3390673.1 hypothetical protein [Methylococcaceae bacterium]
MQENNRIKWGLVLMLLSVFNTGNASIKVFNESVNSVANDRFIAAEQFNASLISTTGHSVSAMTSSKSAWTKQTNLWLLNANKPTSHLQALIDTFVGSALALNTGSTWDVMGEKQWLANWSVSINNLVNTVSVRALRVSVISMLASSEVVAAVATISAVPLSTMVWVFLTGLMILLATRRKHAVLGIVA